MKQATTDLTCKSGQGTFTTCSHILLTLLSFIIMVTYITLKKNQKENIIWGSKISGVNDLLSGTYI